MTLSIMPNKLQKPHLPPNMVVKPETTRLLSTAKINIVSAQAGSGKSTIVSHWLSNQEEPSIWYSLDEWDNDLAQFLTYLAEGIKTIDSEVSGQMEQLLSARQTIGDDALIRSYTTLFHNIRQSFTLVLDDYHVIQDDMIHQMMRTLIGHFPLSMHLCIISREDPPFPLAKLRSQRQLAALRMSDLRFTLLETEYFFSKNLNQPLTSKQLKYLFERTEGWIAGLQLTALSLKGVEDIDHFIADFSESHYYIIDYLLEEVLERHTESIRQFLLKSSIFEYFSPELCDEVLELRTGEAEKCIEFLLKTNSFLITMGSGWFRYHHLFRELLRKRLNLMDRKIITTIYLRAGKWFEGKERHQEAIEHYLNGGHNELAAALIEVKWATMDLELRSSSWLDMAKRLPEDLIKRSPVLSLGVGWALLDRGEVETCEPWFAIAQKLYDQWQDQALRGDILMTDLEEFKQMPVTLMNAKAYIAAVMGDYTQLLKITKELQILAEQHFNKKQWVIETFVATVHWGRGELDEAIHHMTRVKNEALGPLNPLVQNSMVWVIAELYIQKGQLTKAKLLLEKAIDEVQREGIVPVLMATYYLYLAMIASFRGDTDQALVLLEQSKSHGHQFEFMDWQYKYYTLKARLHIQNGSWDLARNCIIKGQNSEFKNPIPECVTIGDMDLWLTLKTEEDEHALKYRIDEAISALEPFLENEPSYTAEMKWKLILKFAPINSYAAKLEPICRILLDRAKAQKRWLHFIEYSVLMMRFTKSEAVKQSLLSSAKQLALDEGIELPFKEFSESIPISSKVHANLSLREPLTERELEVLELIEKGLSNQEIANMLFIALSTVKSYNNSLFGKLEVKRRTEAIAKAKTLGLL